MVLKQHYNPFHFYTTQFTDLYIKAKTTDNPALFLYKNGARNILFMLEGLTRIHKDIVQDEKMNKWHERFKLLEDLLGQIDHTDAYAKQFEKNKVLDTKSILILKTETTTTIAILNKLLVEKKWLASSLEKFSKFIAKQNFIYDASYIKKIKNAYNEELIKIVEFAISLNGNITKLEDEVHEMRRKLRWLSIYAQSFQGVFQLVKPKAQPTWCKKYLKKEIVESPFNKLPIPIKNIPIIYLDYYAFIALSFMINELGSIKDMGLQQHLIKDKFNKTPIQIKNLLGKKYIPEETLLKKASQLILPFFKEKVLDKLVLHK
jgi:hypothetical protein